MLLARAHALVRPRAVCQGAFEQLAVAEAVAETLFQRGEFRCRADGLLPFPAAVYVFIHARDCNKKRRAHLTTFVVAGAPGAGCERPMFA